MHNENFRRFNSLNLAQSNALDDAIPLIMLPSWSEICSLFLAFIFVVLFSDQSGISVSTRLLLAGLLMSVSFCNYVCIRNMRKKIDAMEVFLAMSDGARAIDIAHG